MPRLKKKEPDFIKVTRLIKGYASAPKVAKIIGRSANTARKKLNEPHRFTLGELELICLGAHIPAEDMEASIKF